MGRVTTSVICGLTETGTQAPQALSARWRPESSTVPSEPLTTAEASNLARNGRIEVEKPNLAQTPVLPTLGRPLRPET